MRRGDQVTSIYGGPIMTVTGIREFPGLGRLARCEWKGESQAIDVADFPTARLQLLDKAALLD